MGRNGKKVEVIVIHTMEAPITKATAENVASWFGGPQAPRASAHYCVDLDSVVQCVREEHTAWHAPGANSNGIGIELAGRAAMKAADWEKPDALSTLRFAAVLCAEIAARYDIPIVKLTKEQLKAGNVKGFAGHVDVSKAFGKSDHWDPGPDFPWGAFLGMVKGASEPLTVPNVTLKEAPTSPPLPAVSVDCAGLSWVRLIDSKGAAWDVAPMQIGPVGIGEALALASQQNCTLPTPELVDLIWKSADLKISPMPRTFKMWIMSEMASPTAIADQQRKIREAVAGQPFRLLAGAYKDVVQVGGKVGLYGWHRMNGIPIQPPFFGHNMGWKDYSQGLRLCRRVQ